MEVWRVVWLLRCRSRHLSWAQDYEVHPRYYMGRSYHHLRSFNWKKPPSFYQSNREIGMEVYEFLVSLMKPAGVVASPKLSRIRPVMWGG
ncbi:hypothetical protein AVEN_12563-1 [Araneus ventricosus]|uniref:Uncharacterized protein n=1 Tax=Araneus ventricosus TaxID=182803 RepID=A0A4Y2ABC0_ARAVE|nr:hypothetical protein AVEN_12563-1 [Araneus ventricosus]